MIGKVGGTHVKRVRDEVIPRAEEIKVWLNRLQLSPKKRLDDERLC